jgi:hypothetical protein
MNIYLRFEIELQGEKTLENRGKIPLAYVERGQPTCHLHVNLAWNAHVINALYINLVIPIIFNSSRHFFPFSLSIFDAPLLWKKKRLKLFYVGFSVGNGCYGGWGRPCQKRDYGLMARSVEFWLIFSSVHQTQVIKFTWLN